MSRYKDITGKRFGRLVVIKYKETKNNYAMWLCKCDCGNETIALSKTKLYKRWQTIKRRCYNTNCKDYKLYGGRGIQMCNEWKNNFVSFYNWAIENGYNEHLEKYGSINTTIDRIDVNGNYEPNNCRWATQKEQANNKR